MTVKESKSIGGKQAIKAAKIIFIIFELVMLYFETKGDFANGILFFVQVQINGIALSFLIIYFVTMYLIGRQVGISILIKNKIYYIVGLVWGCMATLLIVLVNLLFMILFVRHDFIYNKYEVVTISIRNFFIFIVPMLLVWVWAAYQIKKKSLSLN
jgi:hypothetical protein